MAQSLCCPLCSSKSFSSNNNLCLALIDAASKWIRCTLCEEEIRGLDKLTIHLIGHLIHTEEFKQFLLIDSKDKNIAQEIYLSKCTEPLNLIKSKEDAREHKYKVAVNEKSENFPSITDSLGSSQIERPSLKIDEEVMIVFNHCTSGKYQQYDKQTQMVHFSESKINDTEIGFPRFTINFKTNDANVEENNANIDNSISFSATGATNPPKHPKYCSDIFLDSSSLCFVETNLTNDQATVNKGEEMDLISTEKDVAINSSVNSSKSNKASIVSSGNENETDILSKLEQLSHSKSSYLSPSGERVLGFRCDVCSLVFPDEQILNLHRQLIHIELNSDQESTKSYRCHLCSKSFVMKGSLMVHMRVAHFGGAVVARLVEAKQLETDAVSPDSAPYVCSICNKGFRKESQLTKHEKFHEGKQCDVCFKTFTTKYFLRKHKRLHTGEMPYQCSVCNKSFTFQQSYHKHLLYHSDEKRHTCDECGRAFKELSTLHNHRRIHTGEKPFACETCGL